MKWKELFWLFTYTSQQLWCQLEKLKEIKQYSKPKYILLYVMQENYTTTWFIKTYKPPKLSLAHGGTFVSSKGKNNSFYQAEWAKPLTFIIYPTHQLK